MATAWVFTTLQQSRVMNLEPPIQHLNLPKVLFLFRLLHPKYQQTNQLNGQFWDKNLLCHHLLLQHSSQLLNQRRNLRQVQQLDQRRSVPCEHDEQPSLLKCPQTLRQMLLLANQ